jgi:2-keto-3-deoxy-L-rhamnonate aldolase RhmA
MNRGKNPLLDMLERRQVPLGIQCFTGHPALIEVMGLTGFDFVMVDTEHSGNNARSLEEIICAIDGAGMATLVRVPDLHDETAIRRALEAGACGLFLPLVKTANDVRSAAQAAFFPPKGRRGICPAIRAASYDFAHFRDYAEWNNREVLLIPMLEQPEAIDNIEAICALEEVKMVVFAPGDLAYSMGEGTLMMKSPKIQHAYRKVLAVAKQHGVHVIGGPVLDPTPEACRKALQDGVSVLTLGLDTLGFRRFCEQTVAATNAGVEGTDWTRPTAPPSGFPR